VKSFGTLPRSPVAYLPTGHEKKRRSCEIELVASRVRFLLPCLRPPTPVGQGACFRGVLARRSAPGCGRSTPAPAGV